MATQAERDAERNQRDAERQQREQRALHRQATIQRIKDIAWTAVIASVITIIVVTWLGWLTTQAVVEKAREQGAKELVALRVCPGTLLIPA
jgi:anti-sigma factor RsiW